MNIANYLTISRLFISPVFLVVYLMHQELGISFFYLPYVLIFLLGISEFSDAMDGYLARKYDQVTDLGKILDPMADSISRIAVFLAFTEGVVQLPMLFVFILLYRDSLISTLRTVCALRGHALAARSSGKIKAILQAIAIFTILILMIPFSLGQLSLETLQFISRIMVGFTCLYSVFSGLEYLYANREHIRKIHTSNKKTSNAQ
jgi:CDP-diacylglycerol---glycerol-3-phosphate 3-phosphatidyltransferase